MENSVLYDNSSVSDILEEATISGKSSLTGKAEEAGDYPLTLVAQIDVPSFTGGENLTASHVDVSGDYAYVSYNTVKTVMLVGEYYQLYRPDQSSGNIQTILFKCQC